MNLFFLSEWEKEKMDYLKKMARIKDAEDNGMSKGIEQGIEQGSKQSKIEIAKNLLKNNISLEIIHESTGLSIDEINNLVNEKEGA